MNRDQMIEKAARAMLSYVNHPDEPEEEWQRVAAREEAVLILDAILPPVSTVEELEALPVGVGMVGADGTLLNTGEARIVGYSTVYKYTNGRREYSARRIVADHGPLTVVWQPCT